MTDIEIHAQFATAVSRGDLKTARDLVTLMDTSPAGAKKRVAAYKAIVTAALNLGRITTAQEASAFCGHIISPADLNLCCSRAIAAGDLENAVTCKRYLDSRFTESELAALGFEPSSERETDKRALLEIISTHIKRRDLLPKELALIWRIENGLGTIS